MSEWKCKKWNNQTDKVMTSKIAAKDMVEYISKYFVDWQSFLEPCRWSWNIYNLLPNNKERCEIDEWKDFYDYGFKVDWIITNPPYSDFDMFMDKCMSVADNIVFLIPLAKPFSSLWRINKIKKYWWIVEMVVMPYWAWVCWFPFWFPVCIWYIKRWYTWIQKIIF